MTEIQKEISARLAELITYLITEKLIKDQNEFADATELSRGHLSEMKHGKKGLPIGKAAEICYLYGVSANWLLLGRGDMMFKEEDTLMNELLTRVSEIQKQLKKREKNGKKLGQNGTIHKNPTLENQALKKVK